MQTVEPYSWFAFTFWIIISPASISPFRPDTDNLSIINESPVFRSVKVVECFMPNRVGTTPPHSVFRPNQPTSVVVVYTDIGNLRATQTDCVCTRNRSYHKLLLCYLDKGCAGRWWWEEFTETYLLRKWQSDLHLLAELIVTTLSSSVSSHSGSSV